MAPHPGLTAVAGSSAGARPRTRPAGVRSVRDAQHHGVSQEPARPTVGGDHDTNEIVRSPRSATDGAHDALALLGAQPDCGSAGVADVAVPVLAAEHERLGTTAVA